MGKFCSNRRLVVAKKSPCASSESSECILVFLSSRAVDMYGADKVTDDTERTAFRRAEKKYKLYYDQDTRSSRKKKQPKRVDLSEVLDFKSILDVYKQSGELPSGVIAFQCGFDYPIFCLESRPGFYFIPGALSIEEQCQWIRESLTRFPQPPNRTNHNAIYGPIHDLFAAAKEKKALVEIDNAPADLDSGLNGCISNGDAHRWKFYEEHGDLSRRKTCKFISALVLLRKLRWSTLGVQFDWSKRNYNVSLPHNKIPDALCQLAKRMAAPAMPIGEEFRPEAAIVNYFGLGDTLGGHVDDMEADWSKPIVSMSLGCKAIFLLGGKSREDIPLAMFLRSGDVVLMAQDARECFHGVPRIFTDTENAEITSLELHLSHENDFLEYIRTSRINVNIRQVF
uniref:Alpha-ketoglutarate-dependent dioxygenase alkB n=2 Tax=Rhizophora mucronata TaxID=61149 RepID=A0A2P2IP85_RHIMU